jgi:hypothetical protein
MSKVQDEVLIHAHFKTLNKKHYERDGNEGRVLGKVPIDTK